MVTSYRVFEQDLLTTGEAAELLKVSRSTVSRLFDRGELLGEANPITGERRISRHSALEMLRKHARPRNPAGPVTPHRILLATSSPALAERIRKIADIHPRLAMTPAAFGADALIVCSRACPDLLVMDGHLEDIATDVVTAALRRQEATRHLKILCLQDPPPSGLLPDVTYIPDVESLEDTVLREHIDGLLNVADTLADTGTERHGRRRWKRHPVSIPARIGIYPSRSPRQRYWGKAVIENISRGGAFLNNIKMDDGVLTASPFRLLVQTDHAPLESWEAKCQVTRLCCNDHVSAGVQFMRLPEPDRHQLLRLCG